VSDGKGRNGRNGKKGRERERGGERERGQYHGDDENDANGKTHTRYTAASRVYSTDGRIAIKCGLIMNNNALTVIDRHADIFSAKFC